MVEFRSGIVGHGRAVIDEADLELVLEQVLKALFGFVEVLGDTAGGRWKYPAGKHMLLS